MNIPSSNQRNHGLTVLEAVVVIFVLFVLVGIFLLVLNSPSPVRLQINCAENLKQVALAFKLWEGDNNDKYPMTVSVTDGGAMEAIAAGDAVAVFQVMSNELSTPKVLVCSEDKNCQWATNFAALTPNNVSYFVGMDARTNNSKMAWSGDDNFEIAGLPVKSGLLKISALTPIAWSAARHKLSGNLMLADGSVQSLDNSMLKAWQRSTNFTSMRLAIP